MEELGRQLLKCHFGPKNTVLIPDDTQPGQFTEFKGFIEEYELQNKSDEEIMYFVKKEIKNSARNNLTEARAAMDLMLGQLYIYQKNETDAVAANDPSIKYMNEELKRITADKDKSQNEKNKDRKELRDKIQKRKSEIKTEYREYRNKINTEVRRWFREELSPKILADAKIRIKNTRQLLRTQENDLKKQIDKEKRETKINNAVQNFKSQRRREIQNKLLNAQKKQKWAQDATERILKLESDVYESNLRKVDGKTSKYRFVVNRDMSLNDQKERNQLMRRLGHQDYMYKSTRRELQDAEQRDAEEGEDRQDQIEREELLAFPQQDGEAADMGPSDYDYNFEETMLREEEEELPYEGNGKGPYRGR